jgi:hypothetical protein
MLRTIAIVTVLSLFSASVEVAAQESRDQARSLFEQGVELFGQEQYDQALQLFQASYDLNPALIALFNIAMCQRALELYAESIESFERYLEMGGDQVDEELRAEVRTHIEEMRSRQRALRVNMVPSDAEVLVDGNPVPADWGGVLRLPPGTYEIVARARGYDDHRQMVTISGPRVTDIQIELERVAPPPPPNGQTEQLWRGRRLWWLWTVIAVAVVGGTAAGLAVGLSGDDTRPMDVEVKLP